MRTAILLGSILIADAIKLQVRAESTVQFLAIVLVVMMVMDVADFFRGKS